MDEWKSNEVAYLERSIFGSDGAIEIVTDRVTIIEVNGRRAKVLYGDGSLDWVNVRDMRREGR